MIERSTVVRIKDGLHTRPATQLVKLARTFLSEVEVRRGDRAANAKSPVKLMLLAIKEHEAVVVRAQGADAEAAIAALVSFIETPHAGGDPDEHIGAAGRVPVSAVRGMARTAAAGIAASEGVALGPAFGLFPEDLRVANRSLAPEVVDAELAALRRGFDITVTALLESGTKSGALPQDAQIIEALLAVAQDAQVIGAIEAEVRTGIDAATAVVRAGQRLAESFERVENAVIKARAVDVRGFVRALALTLLGKADADLAAVPAGSIVVAEEISAWDFARAPARAIAGILCLRGAATSHVAIMARTHGIPAVFGSGATLAALRAAKTVALDGTSGEVWLDPDPQMQADLHIRIAREAGEREALDAYRSLRPVTRSGQPIEVAANLGSLKEIEPALRAGAMGVGLFRTELLFIERRTLPSEDEQVAIYRELAEAFAPHAVIVRTLDAGGDKAIAGVAFPPEHNPALGWRGVRMCLDRPDVFKPQLRALLRAAVHGTIKVMVPMITHVDEVLRVKALLAECARDLDAAGVARGDPDLGIMMETPAAALLARDLAEHVAFFSIGTNDLTQYVMAADRLNSHVAGLNRADHPAVLRAIALICEAAKAQGIWVGLCGEAAAQPELIPTFIRMGITEFSMSPASIARAKRAIIESGEPETP